MPGTLLRILGLSLVALLSAAGAARVGLPDDDGALFQSTPNDHAQHKAKGEFLKRFPQYGYNGRIDELYAQEIAPRLGPGEHYLDWTAAGLYWNSQVAAAAEELREHVFGNPHCTSPSAQRTETIVDGLRVALLRFFGANPEEYTLVFTRSGTGALHLLGEAFPWTPASRFAYLTSNHNSVLGIREYARAHNSSFGAIKEEEVEAWLGSTTPAAPAVPAGGLEATLKGSESMEASSSPPTYSLFAYPAYDNYAGIMYPLSWVRGVQARSNATHVWKVLLDAAAFVPTHRLNLTETPADFVDLSFYKLFGYPTGVGALILRNENVDLLRKGYWGGGTVFLATATLDWNLFFDAPRRFEHGTLPFLDIIALQHGLEALETLGGISAVQDHVDAVGQYLYEELARLKHSNGEPVVRVFGKHHLPNRREVQGNTLNIELLSPRGEVLGYREAGAALGRAGFHIRVGCTCNPGACYEMTGVRDEEVRKLAEELAGHYEDWEWIWVHRDKLVKRPLGSIRISLGQMSRFEDAYALAQHIKATYTDLEAPSDAPGPEGKAQGEGAAAPAPLFPLYPGGC